MPLEDAIDIHSIQLPLVNYQPWKRPEMEKISRPISAQSETDFIYLGGLVEVARTFKSFM